MDNSDGLLFRSKHSAFSMRNAQGCVDDFNAVKNGKAYKVDDAVWNTVGNQKRRGSFFANQP